MAEIQNIGGFVTAVFQAWKTAEINFLVLRNYEDLPDFTSNDIDILIAANQLRLAEETLVSTATHHGFCLHNRVEFATLALYFSHLDSLQQAHFDLFTHLEWRGLEYLCVKDFLPNKIDQGSFAVPSPAHEATANLLGLFIYTGQIKEKYKHSICTAFRSQPDSAIRLLAKTYGDSLADFLVKNAAEERWGKIEKNLGAVRRTLIVHQFAFHLFKTLGSFARNFVRVLKRFLQPTGLMVVLLGADGSGKSTVGAAILEQLQNTFSPQKNFYLHWKPRMFSKAKSGPTTNPHGQKTRGTVVSLFFFAFHCLEFFLGAWKEIRPVLFKGGLVLIDRYYLDLFVDQKRYRLHVPRSLLSFAWIFLKKPDLVLMLDAPTEILQSRKQEVAPEETERQQTAYRDLLKKIDNGFILDAAQPVEIVAANASKTVLNFLSARTRKRLGASLK